MSLLASPPSWPRILDCIRKRITPQQYATWFQHLRAVSLESGGINVRVPNRFFKEWLAQNYLGVIREGIEEITGATPSVTFTIDETLHLKDAPSSHPAPEAAPAPRVSGMNLNEDYTFHSFVVDQGALDARIKAHLRG